MKLNHAAALRSSLGAALAIFISVAPASSQSALPHGVDAFVAAANALAKSASERVDLGRATIRLNLLRREVTDKLLAAKPGDPVLRLALNEESILCDARTANVEVAARRNYIQAVAAKIDETGKPSKIDNLESALKSLFSGQSLDIDPGISDLPDLAKSQKRIRDRCVADIKQFDLAYYGRDLVPVEPAMAAVPGPAGAPLFGAIGALLDVIGSIVTPIVVEGAKIVDEQRRRDEILRFLQDLSNRKKIEDSGLALAKEISVFTWDKRLRLAGAFNERISLLRTGSIDLSKNEFCKRYFASGKPLDPAAKRLTDDFVLCWRGAWEQAQANVSALLKSAEEYDQLADAGDTDNAKYAFEPLSKALGAVGNTDNNSLIWFWNMATRLIAFAHKVETAFGKESREKVNKAIDDLVKAI